MALQHLADMVATRIEDGDSSGAVELAANADKSYLKYAIGESTGAFDVPEEQVENGDGQFTKEELVALVEAVAESNADGE